MKKIFTYLFILFLLLITNICFAQPVSNDISNKYGVGHDGCIPVKSSQEQLYGCLLIGVDTASSYYLDESSCTYTIDGNYAILSCLIYKTGGGANPDGTPYFFRPHTYTFKTFKDSDGSRKILVQSIIQNESGENVTQMRLRYDNGFLRYLFWQIAKHTGINECLD